MHRYQGVDFTGPPSQRYGVAQKEEVRNAIKDSMPDLYEMLDTTIEEVVLLQRAFFTGIENQAAGTIGNHALNDFDSLIDSLVSGNGRDAAHACRSLYEHLINYCEVTTSDIAQQRYIAHRSITAITLARISHGTSQLKGLELKREKNRIKKLQRDNSISAAQSIASFGSRFHADWSERNLRDRARAHGYEHHYDTYKLLSQVTHGSSGGILGTHSLIQGFTVHRIGPSLDLAIFAYLEGLRFFRHFVSEVGKNDLIDTTSLIISLDHLIAFWPTYRRSLHAIDRDLWPATPPPPPIAIMALYPNGRIRWFYLEPVLNIMKRALKPAEHEYWEEKFSEYVAEINLSDVANQDGRPITCSVAGVTLVPSPGSKWFKASAVLMERETPMADWLDGAPRAAPGAQRSPKANTPKV
ncbi:DUF5677 domain-containing protein [Streptomyces sp. NPDC093795]|uniref:DUF5677 domain-containing protein n=1 Tax=Streptomyces sp. NPDC093795 TaxID=3366051 RepID=UPI00380ABEEA